MMLTDNDGYMLVLEMDSSGTPDLIRVYVADNDGDYVAADITADQARQFANALQRAATITDTDWAK